MGCDGKLGSEKEFDECRVCGGDGSSCHFKKGSVTTDELVLGMFSPVPDQFSLVFYFMSNHSLC